MCKYSICVVLTADISTRIDCTSLMSPILLFVKIEHIYIENDSTKYLVSKMFQSLNNWQNATNTWNYEYKQYFSRIFLSIILLVYHLVCHLRKMIHQTVHLQCIHDTNWRLGNWYSDIWVVRFITHFQIIIQEMPHHIYQSNSTEILRHYGYVIMNAIASLIPSVSIACSAVCTGAEQREHQISASLASVRGFHRRAVNFPHKGPWTRKCFHLMTSS